MASISKVPKDTNPPGVGGGRRKEKEKPIWWKQRNIASKGIVSDHGTIRWSIRNHPETTFSLTGDTAVDEVKKKDCSPSLEGSNKLTAVKGEYNIFVITLFHLNIIYTTTFHHIAISPCEHGCLLSATFHHICFSIALYQYISPFHHYSKI